jgi:hypothetical protein
MGVKAGKLIYQDRCPISDLVGPDVYAKHTGSVADTSLAYLTDCAAFRTAQWEGFGRCPPR